MIKILGLDKFIKKMKRIEKVYEGNETEEAIGKEFKGLVQQTFNDKKSPFGKKWTPSNNPDTLVDTGALFDSVTYKASKGTIVVSAGSGLDYARDHNNGEGMFPKRQFLPNEGKIPKKWRDIAMNIIQEELKKEVNK
jgi:phage gpG-like protein